MTRAFKPFVLILCSGNSCRSQIAEGLLRAAAGDILDVRSAGMKPAGHVHPLAIRVMAEVGIDLYTSKTSPVNSVVIVTHGITEAVFMATRLVVMGAHPGAVRAVLDNPLPYPRDEHHPDFISLCQRVHALVTRTMIPREPAAAVPAGQRKLLIHFRLQHGGFDVAAIGAR